jgi:uncharacterized protein (DUF2236 family)
MSARFSAIPGLDVADTQQSAGRMNDPGLYGPGSAAWRLNREATLLLGAGPRALLMQLAHPLVAEGVAQHSNFRADPWRRLRTTLRSYLTIVYGDSSQARAEIGRLNRFHREIQGPVHDPAAQNAFGSAYSARDPDLSLWVHATLIDATLVAHERWIGPLPAGQRAAFYAETRPIGRALGVPEAILPVDIGGFDAYLARMIGPAGPIKVGPIARDLAGAILRPPLGPLHPILAGLPTGLYAWTMWPSVGLLPESIRQGYGLAWGRRQRLVSAWLTAGFRGWRPILPLGFRTMPWALAADARMARQVPG